MLQAFKDFHKDIQIFAVAFYQLQKIAVDTQTGFNIKLRNDIFLNISNGTKRLMCEVEQAFDLIKCPRQLHERIPVNYLDDKKWLKSTDLTNMCTQDRGVLMAYDEFILKWKKIFANIRRMNGKKKNRKGNNRQQKPLNKRTQRRREKNNKKTKQ